VTSFFSPGGRHIAEPACVQRGATLREPAGILSQVLHYHINNEGATMYCPADSGGRSGHGDDEDDKDVEELQPSLKRIHSDATITSGSNRFSYDFWRQQSTNDILFSRYALEPTKL
jgi:hypothetical protein